MAELRIPIIGEFKGNKAFKDAGKATSALDKSVKQLGKTLAGVFGAQQLLRFAKNASKAFIEDEAAATRLAQSVKNLGLAFETPNIEQFIAQLSKASGVTDNQLRPSMQKLLQTTGSVAKSTELLTQALDISRGSGVDFETVVNDLNMAYVGQTRGLRKYSLGLSLAELKTMKFSDVQAKLTKQFSGANAVYLETYAGKMQILTTAAGEAQETIGKGLVDSLSLLSGGGNSIQPLADSMAEFSTNVSDAVYGIAVLIDKIKQIPGIDFLSRNQSTIFRNLPNTGLIIRAYEALTKLGTEGKPGMGGYPSSALGGVFIDPNDAARKKAEADAVKRAKALEALQKKTVASQKQQNALTKASKTLNLEAISIEAALKGKISETDKLSLLLQKAILEGNDVAAKKLSDQLDAAIKKQKELEEMLRNLPKTRNPFEDWKIPKLDFGGNLLGTQVPNFTPPSFMTPEFLKGVQAGSGATAYTPPETVVNVEVKVAGEDVAAIITQQQNNQSLSGTFSSVNRIGRFATVPDSG